MNEYTIINIKEQAAIISRAAEWFHQKWGVPAEAYSESMGNSLEDGVTVPQWYVALDGDRIIGGLGVIENDFHERRDLSPNVCAVYVEEDCRCRGIAGKLLERICRDCKNAGIDTLYLITDHTSFYERYGWEFLCTVQCDEGETSRMYVHRS